MSAILDIVVATKIAQELEITLTNEHVFFLEQAINFYQEFGLSPNNKAIVNYANQNLQNKISILDLMELFNNYSAKEICKIAGLPKPHNCI